MKLSCRKSVRRCGAKHIFTFPSQSAQSTLAVSFGALLKVELSKKCTPLWHTDTAHSQVTSQSVQNTSASGQFWKWSSRKSARLCGAKHIAKSKPKCTKHVSFGALLKVELSKKCTPLWCEANFQLQVKVHKAP